MSRRPRRKTGILAPVWAPTPLDFPVRCIYPFVDWVIVKERPEITRFVSMSNELLEIFRPKDIHTVYGQILGIHPTASEELDIQVDDEIVYREWSGGRWDVQGEQVLIMKSTDILAKVDNES